MNNLRFCSSMAAFHITGSWLLSEATVCLLRTEASTDHRVANQACVCWEPRQVRTTEWETKLPQTGCEHRTEIRTIRRFSLRFKSSEKESRNIITSQWWVGSKHYELAKSVPVRLKNTAWKHTVPSVGPLWETDEVKRTCSWLFDGLKHPFTSGKVFR